MKKCQGCHREIDKYAIACDYCGKLNEGREKPGAQGGPEARDKKKHPKSKTG